MEDYYTEHVAFTFEKDESTGAITILFDKLQFARFIKIHSHFYEMDEAGESLYDESTMTLTDTDPFDVFILSSGRNEFYTYDPKGNREKLSYFTTSFTSYNYSYYPGSDLIKTDGKYGYKYDANGNRLEKGSVYTELGDELIITKEDEYFRYEYDLLNRLERVYSLDEATGIEVFVKSYVYNAAGETLYYGTDHLGSSVLMTDSIGAAVWTGAVTPFADQENTEGLSEHVMFTGKELDTDTGLYYYNARWYDPQLGRFITEDPARANSNWFIYASNNPLNFIDPTGLEDAPFNTQTGPIPTIKEVETGDNWYNNVFDTIAAGAAGILNWGASLGNMAIGGLAGIGEGLEKLDDAIPDKHSLTGMGQVEDLNAIALYLGMNPVELAMAMQGMKNLPVKLAGMGR